MIDDDAGLRRLLANSRTIAVVGMSANSDRPSNEVARYLRHAGYTVIPVNPAYPEILGEPCYPSLREVPVAIDLVDVFRNPDDVLPIVDDAIAIGAKSLWLQLGVIVPAAVQRAELAGMQVVMDRCTKIEHRRLF